MRAKARRHARRVAHAAFCRARNRALGTTGGPDTPRRKRRGVKPFDAEAFAAWRESDLGQRVGAIARRGMD